MQEVFRLPRSLHDIWDGPKYFGIREALRKALVTPEEFDACWEDRLRSAMKNDRDKQQLLQWLEKGGLRADRHGAKATQLRQRVWFISQIIGREIKASTETDKRVCIMYVCMYVCR